ncbi:hypothetical protein IQ266_09090 [filamentous cyanobacterium LEGE 11480]|uniref:Secreted protein n=1 Tax=Romeriopsis navalis LEGE 11480 TaxID=2777977 RepID=A0A928VK91_9CYAN|nr:hypothetical protein [Romeriopsis navalis]MBE9029880.1 hypothetical protein [Romeriopsis navalis LEGE 11480]
MSRFILKLATATGLVGSALCWLMAMPAAANVEQRVSDPMLDINEAQVCVMSEHSRFNLVCERVNQIKDREEITAPIDLAENPDVSPDEFVFSDQESNAAVALFGCDCPTCINALRNLRMMAVG